MRIKHYLSPFRSPFVHLIAVTGCLYLTACKDQTSIEKAKALEAEIEQHQLVEAKVKQDLQRLEAKIEAAQRENAELKEQNAKSEAASDAKSKDLEKVQKEFEAFRAKYKLGMVKRVPGMHIADFSVDGTAYRAVVLKEMTESQLSFAHQDGLRKLPLNLLPEPLRDMLGLNIVLADENTNVALDPKAEKAMRIADHRVAVGKAEDEKMDILAKVDATRRKLNAAKLQLYTDNLEHKPTTDLKKKIEALEKELVKLESLKATAEINLYQARQEASKNLPTR